VSWASTFVIPLIGLGGSGAFDSLCKLWILFTHWLTLDLLLSSSEVMGSKVCFCVARFALSGKQFVYSQLVAVNGYYLLIGCSVSLKKNF